MKIKRMKKGKKLQVSNVSAPALLLPDKNQRLLRATSWNLLELKIVPFVRCFS